MRDYLNPRKPYRLVSIAGGNSDCECSRAIQDFRSRDELREAAKRLRASGVLSTRSYVQQDGSWVQREV